jgi:hypothetical protein
MAATHPRSEDHVASVSSLPDLSADPRALRVMKRPIPVQVRFATADGICQTLEGPVGYRVGDAILTGISGEIWPVERAKFNERYVPFEGSVVGTDGNYLKKPVMVFALRLDAPIQVPMPAGGILRGVPGDWLLQYGIGDYGIAKDEILRATYDLR